MPEWAIALRRATPEDTAPMMALMDSVLDWLVARGITEQWGQTPFSRIPGFSARVGDWAGQGVITVAEREGRCVGLIAAASEVPPEVPAGTVPAGSVFIHTVLSDRGPAGQGAGTALLDDAAQRARSAGAPALALAHWASSAALARVYHRHGYVATGEYTEEQQGRQVPHPVRTSGASTRTPRRRTCGPGERRTHGRAPDTFWTVRSWCSRRSSSLRPSAP